MLELTTAGRERTSPPLSATSRWTESATSSVATLRANPRNALLAALPERDAAVLAEWLELVTLPRGETLVEHGATASHVWMPETAVIAVRLDPGDGTGPVDVAAVGREGVACLDLALGALPGPRALVTSIDGDAWRMPAQAFIEAARTIPSLHAGVARAGARFARRLAQSVLCERAHVLRHRLATLLLETSDRIASDRLTITHAELAAMLGVRRAGVTEAVIALQSSGAIYSSRGRMTIQDRGALAAVACPCFTALSTPDRGMEDVALS